MRLLCANCGKVIVQSPTLDHYACCAQCDVTKLTKEQVRKIEESGAAFRQAAREGKCDHR